MSHHALPIACGHCGKMINEGDQWAESWGPPEHKDGNLIVPNPIPLCVECRSPRLSLLPDSSVRRLALAWSKDTNLEGMVGDRGLIVRDKAGDFVWDRSKAE